MVRKKLLFVLILVIFVIGCAPLSGKGEAEVPPAPPAAEAAAVDMSTVQAPSPEHEFLGTWVGQWKGKGIIKESPMGPGGEMEWTEDCEWFEGTKFNVVCTSEGTGPMGTVKGLGITGYDMATGEYTHYGVDNGGWMAHSKGKLEGHILTMVSRQTMGAETFYSRFVIDTENPSKMLFSWDTSPDGETWTQMMEGVSEKQF